jgi:hypothetical protein
MSEENVDTLRAVYDEWRRGNFRAGGELFDAYTVCVVDPESPEPGLTSGRVKSRLGCACSSNTSRH